MYLSTISAPFWNSLGQWYTSWTNFWNNIQTFDVVLFSLTCVSFNLLIRNLHCCYTLYLFGQVSFLHVWASRMSQIDGTMVVIVADKMIAMVQPACIKCSEKTCYLSNYLTNSHSVIYFKFSLVSFQDAIIKTLITAHPILKHNYRTCFPNHNKGSACFEILGFDILLDKKLKAWVLEVTTRSSLLFGICGLFWNNYIVYAKYIFTEN